MSEATLSIPVDRAALSEHYKQVESFQAMRTRSAYRTSKVLVGVTAIALFANLAQAWTIASLVPLTKIVPVYLWVRDDGSVDSSVSMSRLPATQSEAIIRSALWEYVRLREGYTYDTAQYAYDVVSEMSSPQVREEYQTFFNYPNPLSPQVTIGKKGTVFIEHIGSADIGTNLQQIRFRRVQSLDAARNNVTTWTATIKYTTVADLPVEYRLRNAGGIIITSYQAAKDSVQ